MKYMISKLQPVLLMLMICCIDIQTAYSQDDCEDSELYRIFREYRYAIPVIGEDLSRFFPKSVVESYKEDIASAKYETQKDRAIDRMHSHFTYGGHISVVYGCEAEFIGKDNEEFPGESIAKLTMNIEWFQSKREPAQFTYTYIQEDGKWVIGPTHLDVRKKRTNFSKERVIEYFR